MDAEEIFETTILGMFEVYFACLLVMSPLDGIIKALSTLANFEWALMQSLFIWGVVGNC